MVTKEDYVVAALEAAAEKVSEPVQPEFLKYLLDLTQPVVDAEYLLSIGNIPTFPKGELIALTAKAKQGKSQAQYYLIAVMLAGRQLGDVKPLQDSYKILLFDTEQSKATLMKCCKRALRFAGLEDNLNDNRFKPFSLREVEPSLRLKYIEEAIKEEKPTVVFIDGIVDLVQDFNSNIESGRMIQQLLKMTTEYGCSISCILHQNKGTDNNMRGHLGTELLNKVTDCFTVKKNGDKFVVSCLVSRNEPCSGFSFSIDKENNYYIEEYVLSEAKDVENQQLKIRRILRSCFSEHQSMTYTELVDAYMQQGGVGKSTAKSHVKEAKEEGFLSLSNKLYCIASD
ncbi:AAA family ATPase [Phocaeicola sp.]